MNLEIFRKPTTLGELIFNAYTGSNNSSEDSFHLTLYHDLFVQEQIEKFSLDIPNPFRREFTLNDQINDEDELIEVEKRLYKKWVNQKIKRKKNTRLKGKKRAVEFIETYNEFFERLNPKNVLESEITDCKGMSILALTWYRSDGRATKFASTPTHFKIERWYRRTKEWIVFDPAYLNYSSKTGPTRDNKYDEYLKRIIEHFLS